MQDLAKRAAIVLDIEVTAIDVERYLCNDGCYKSIKRVEKIQEEAKQLKSELKRNFASTNRFKRGILSDTSLSPNTLAPTKSARQDQMTNTRQIILEVAARKNVKPVLCRTWCPWLHWRWFLISFPLQPT